MSRNKNDDNKPVQETSEQENSEPRKVFLHEDHGRPTTRRDFLATGLIGFSGFMIAPSILSLLTRSEEASAAGSSCGVSGGARLPAFVAINLAGGAALAGNYVALDQGGSLLPGYNLLGLGTQPPLELEFGKVAFAGAPTGSTRLTSQFLAGLRTTASRTTLDKASFIGVCVPLQDDSGNNRIDPSGLVTAAGLAGELLPKMGTQETATGIRQMPAVVPPPAPLVVRNVNDLLGALAPAGSLATRLNAGQRQSLLRMVSSLSGTQARTVAQPNSVSGRTLSKLIQCATDKNIELAATTNPGVDPRLDTNVGIAALWGMTTGGNQFGRSQNERTAMGSMVYNALKGNAGAVGLDIGGYDYHGNNRQGVTDVRDNEAGQLVGKVLESAALMGQKVFIHVTSDGSVGAPSGSDINASFTGDRGSGGMSYIIVFDPAGRPALKDPSRYQLGWFNRGQGADDQSPVGSAEAAGKAVFANYLQFAKQINLYEKIANERADNNLDQVIKLA